MPCATPRASCSILSGKVRLRSSFSVRTVPPSRAVSGMMLKAVPAPISPTVSTAGSTGSTSLETTVCSAVTIWAAMAIASAVRCGIAPCPPAPLTVISKASAAAMMGPAFVATFPNGSPGHRCSANMDDTSSATPSSTMILPPPPPSSAGWKKNLTLPLNLSRIPERAWAAPTSMLVCPSWPQACILPSVCEAKGSPVSSWIGNASMSALNPTVGPSPSPLRVATTPFSATPVCISRVRPSRAASTFPAVFSVSKPSSGSRWMSRLRATILSPTPTRTSSSRPSNLWTTLISRSLPRGSLSLQPSAGMPGAGRSRRRLRGPERRLERQADGDKAREQVGGGRPLAGCRETERARYPGEDFSRALAKSVPIGERHRAMSLGEAPPVGSENQRDVGVSGDLQIEQAIEQDLARRRVEEVRAPHYLAHPLSGVVHHDGELVGGDAVVTAYDEVVNLSLVPPEASRSARSFAVSSRQVPGYRSAAEIPCGAEAEARISARVQ